RRDLAAGEGGENHHEPEQRFTGDARQDDHAADPEVPLIGSPSHLPRSDQRQNSSYNRRGRVRAATSLTSSPRTRSKRPEVFARGGNPVVGSCLDAKVGTSLYAPRQSRSGRRAEWLCCRVAPILGDARESGSGVRLPFGAPQKKRRGGPGGPDRPGR